MLLWMLQCVVAITSQYETPKPTGHAGGCETAGLLVIRAGQLCIGPVHCIVHDADLRREDACRP